MAGHLFALIVALLSLAVAGVFAQSPLGKPLESGGFVIYSRDRETRSRLARLAGEAAKEWEKTTGEKAVAQPPVIVVDKSRDALPRGSTNAVCSLFEMEAGGLKVQVDLLDARAARQGVFETEIFRALALRAMHRKNPPKAGKSYELPPAWLVEGLGEDLRRRGGSVPDGVHAALIRSDRPPELREFLKQRPERLDATSLLLYRAQALALVRALAESANSKKHFVDFLETPEVGESTPEKLIAAFPDAAPDAPSLVRMWTLSLARSSMPPRLASLSVPKTDEELAAILDISVPPDGKTPGAVGPGALPLAARGRGGVFFMRQKSVDLLDLEFRAHPLLRPVVEEYRNIAILLSAKPKSKVGSRIEEIEKIRNLLVERHRAISDYLNWFETTRVDEVPNPLLEAARPPPVPRRRDPITLHMDALEQRGW